MSEEKNYTVYMHVAPNGKRYVGITCRDVYQRWSSGYGYMRNAYFWNAIKKYGWDNFEHKILATGLSKEDAEIAEIKCIKHWDLLNPKKGYNICRGGNTTRGYHHLEDTKKRISEKRSGQKLNLSEEQRKRRAEINKGRVVSEETRRKISEALKGKPRSEEWRKHLSEANKGKKLSEETRRKMSISSTGFRHTEETKKKMSAVHQGHPTSDETKRKISKAHKGKTISKEQLAALQKGAAECNKKRMRAIWCEELGCVEESEAAMAKRLGIHQTCVHYCCHGEYRDNSTHGYHLRWATEEEIQGCRAAG